MSKLSIGTVLVAVIIIGLLSISPFQKQHETNQNAENNRNLVKGYTLDLQQQRENCYNNILLLGIFDEKQIENVKLELKFYLKKKKKINNKIKEGNSKNQILNESIELDILLIKKTLTAIETKDESYLYDISEIYHNLIKYHDLLNV